jgi:hypothetical protein
MPVQLQRKMTISVEKNVVTMEMAFPDVYSAIVYRDDIVERLQSGDGLAISIAAPKQRGYREKSVA